MVYDPRIPDPERCVLPHQLERWASERPQQTADGPQERRGQRGDGDPQGMVDGQEVGQQPRGQDQHQQEPEHRTDQLQQPDQGEGERDHAGPPSRGPDRHRWRRGP